MAQPIPQYQYSGQHQHPQFQQQYGTAQSPQYPNSLNVHENQYAAQYHPQNAQQYPQQHQAYAVQNQQQWQGYQQYHHMTLPGQPSSNHQSHGYQAYPPNSGYSNQQEQETCFNCGLPGHFAQNCPEPRRQIPAGQIKRQQRFQHRRSQPDLNTHMHFNTAPVPGPTQIPQPQYHQTPYQQPFVAPATPHNQHTSSLGHWTQPGTPNIQAQVDQRYLNQSPASLHTSYSPPSSVQVPQQNQSFATVPGQWPVTAQRTQSQTSQTSSLHGSANQTPQGWQGNAYPNQVPEIASATVEPNSVQTEPEQQSTEEEEDNLSALDVPDLPAGAGPHVQDSIQLVSCPLPSNFIVADALYPLAAPGPDDAGKCSSKYFLHTSEEKALESIHTSSLWKDRREDTMFRNDLEDTSTVPLNECVTRIADRRDPSSTDDKEKKSRSQSRALQSRSAEAAEMAESLEKVEQALAEAKRMIANKQSKPKAKVTTHQQQQQHNGQSNHLDKPEQQSPTSKDTRTGRTTNGAYSASPPHRPDHPSHRSSEGLPSSVAKQTTNLTPNTGSRHHEQRMHPKPNGTGHMDVHFRRPQYGIPPPPPPPREDTDLISPSTTHYGHGRNGVGSSKNNGVPFRNVSMEQPPSMNRRTSSYGSKRSYDQRMESSSSDEGDSPRRQEDDVTPKHKRRQPKVAEAYSRRW